MDVDTSHSHVGAVQVSLGAAMEFEHEQSVDWGYSFSDSASSTRTDGMESTASVKVQVDPALNSCVRLNVTTRKVKGLGALRELQAACRPVTAQYCIQHATNSNAYIICYEVLQLYTTTLATNKPAVAPDIR